jgi:hypothetical protein
MAVAQIIDDRGNCSSVDRCRNWVDTWKTWTVEAALVHGAFGRNKSMKSLAAYVPRGSSPTPLAISRDNGIHSTKPDLPGLSRCRQESRAPITAIDIE